jgi:hypothetical protein
MYNPKKIAMLFSPHTLLYKNSVFNNTQTNTTKLLQIKHCTVWQRTGYAILKTNMEKQWKTKSQLQKQTVGTTIQPFLPRVSYSFPLNQYEAHILVYSTPTALHHMINYKYLIQYCYIGILTNIKQLWVNEVNTITKCWMKFTIHLKWDIFKFKEHTQVYLMPHVTEDLNVTPTTILVAKAMQNQSG